MRPPSEAAVEELGKIHRTERAAVASRQEILSGFVACLEAQAGLAVVPVFEELSKPGAAAACGGPRL